MAVLFVVPNKHYFLSLIEYAVFGLMVVVRSDSLIEKSGLGFPKCSKG